MSMQQGGMGGMGGHPNGPMGGQNSHMQQQPNPMQSQQQNSMLNGQMNQPSNNSHSPFSSLHNSSSFTGQPADFNLDFLDNIPSTDASNLTAQELLNSLDNSFLNDIL